MIFKSAILVALALALAPLSFTQEPSIHIDAAKLGPPVSRYLTGACIEDVNHEIYGGIYSQMIFGESFQEPPQPHPAKGFFATTQVSGMWTPLTTGDAALQADIDHDHPFIAAQSQRLTFLHGSGEVAIANRGLNHQGMAFIAAKPYEGHLWLRSEKPTEVFASLENRDGTRRYAQTTLTTTGQDWKRYDFHLTPDASDASGQFAIRLKSPGSITIGHAFLQPGDWGRFKDLPVRRDIAQALIDQGITVLRYGGSMVNAPEYRWKRMIGPRDRRPPYKGTWYPYSSNGWGIIDFLNLCEAAGFLPIPDFNMDENPQDMADFMEYVNAAPETPWGRQRAADGHPAPYNLRHIELGNEEKIDDAYFQKFEKLSAAIWAKDPHVILVVGDFQYERNITDPMRIQGADSKITSLAAHQKILQLAGANHREVWFDVHLWTEGPAISSSVKAFKSYVDAIDQLANGAAHHVVVFEFNANKHDQTRALMNADQVINIMRDGRVPVALSANCLQPDGQNDNGWDQGLLFLNPSTVWFQPPGYVNQMFARHHHPRSIETTTTAPLNVAAALSENGTHLSLYVTNLQPTPAIVQIQLDHFTPGTVSIQELTGAPNAVNTAEQPAQIAPITREFKPQWTGGRAPYTFPARSFTIITFDQ